MKISSRNGYVNQKIEAFAKFFRDLSFRNSVRSRFSLTPQIDEFRIPARDALSLGARIFLHFIQAFR